jgi:hypothetical protein
MFDRNGAQHVGRRIVAHEGGEWVTQTRSRLERCIHH